MKQNYLLLMSALLMLVVSMSSCSSDDEKEISGFDAEEISGSGLFGRWRFVEMLDGPIGAGQPILHIMEIRDNGGGQHGSVVFTREDGEWQEIRWEYPNEEDKFLTDKPVIKMVYPEDGEPLIVPYSCEIGSTILKLHYLGFYTTDHIPATYVYKRIK